MQLDQEASWQYNDPEEKCGHGSVKPQCGENNRRPVVMLGMLFQFLSHVFYVCVFVCMWQLSIFSHRSSVE